MDKIVYEEIQKEAILVRKSCAWHRAGPNTVIQQMNKQSHIKRQRNRPVQGLCEEQGAVNLGENKYERELWAIR